MLFDKPYPLIMGILNTTPDSFSDGGRFVHVDKAVEHALQMLASGADIVDIGGESTRPGAQEVSVAQELERVIPVIDSLLERSPDAIISIDTSKPEVMESAIEHGAKMVNDVTALETDESMSIVANAGIKVCLMHMQGKPRTMQQNPTYDNVVNDIKSYLAARVETCIKAGIDKSNIIIDPGFGFGKTLDHNLSLLKHLDEFTSTGLPVLAGVSRKSMFAHLLDLPVEERLSASLACAVLAIEKGAAILRVHDVTETWQVRKVVQSVACAQ